MSLTSRILGQMPEPYDPGASGKEPRVPLAIRLLLAVVLAAAVAAGVSYALRTLNL